MRAIVLAGGLGTRLRGVVPELPKCMAPVAGRPFLEYLLTRLVGGGVTDIVLAVGYRAEAITQHFGSIWNGANLRYSHEATPLGTGGAVAQALKSSGTGSILLLNGDTMLELDYTALGAWQRSNSASLAVILKHVPDTARYGAVQVVDGRIVRFMEKGARGPGLINAGAYLIGHRVFEGLGLAQTFSFETDFLQAHCATLRPHAVISDGFFIDIGTPEDYLLAQTMLPGTGIGRPGAAATTPS